MDDEADGRKKKYLTFRWLRQPKGKLWMMAFRHKFRNSSLLGPIVDTNLQHYLRYSVEWEIFGKLIHFRCPEITLMDSKTNKPVAALPQPYLHYQLGWQVDVGGSFVRMMDTALHVERILEAEQSSPASGGGGSGGNVGELSAEVLAEKRRQLAGKLEQLAHELWYCLTEVWMDIVNINNQSQEIGLQNDASIVLKNIEAEDNREFLFIQCRHQADPERLDHAFSKTLKKILSEASNGTIRRNLGEANLNVRKIASFNSVTGNLYLETLLPFVVDLERQVVIEFIRSGKPFFHLSTDIQRIMIVTEEEKDMITKQYTRLIKKDFSKICKEKFDKVVADYPSAPLHQELALKDAFDAFDEDGNGYIEVSELSNVMKRLNQEVTDEELKEIMKTFDRDGNSQIDWNEFRSFFLNPKTPKGNVTPPTPSPVDLGKFQSLQLEGFLADVSPSKWKQMRLKFRRPEYHYCKLDHVIGTLSIYESPATQSYEPLQIIPLSNFEKAVGSVAENGYQLELVSNLHDGKPLVFQTHTEAEGIRWLDATNRVLSKKDTCNLDRVSEVVGLAADAACIRHFSILHYITGILYVKISSISNLPLDDGNSPSEVSIVILGDGASLAKTKKYTTKPGEIDLTMDESFELELYQIRKLEFVVRRAPQSSVKLVSHAAVKVDSGIVFAAQLLEDPFMTPNSISLSSNDIASIGVEFSFRSQLFSRTMARVNAKLFGAPLQNVAAPRPSRVPKVVERLISEIESRDLSKEGLYRITGNVSRIRNLRAELEQNEDAYPIDVNNCPDVHNLCSVLKYYFRELPDPLLTVALHDELCRTTAISDVVPLLCKLPLTHFATMIYLFDHLHRVATNGTNKMNEMNLSTVFAPILLRSNEQEGNAEPSPESASASASAPSQSSRRLGDGFEPQIRTIHTLLFQWKAIETPLKEMCNDMKKSPAS